MRESKNGPWHKIFELTPITIDKLYQKILLTIRKIAKRNN